MKLFWAVTISACFVFSGMGAEKNPAADAAWAEVLKSARPPSPPAEWNQKAPTPEQVNEFKKKAGDLAAQVADQTKKFYEQFPDDPRATEAKSKEKVFRSQAAALRGTPGQPEAKQQQQAANPAFQEKLKAAMAEARAARQGGPKAVAEELEKHGRALTKEFPSELEAWQLLFMGAQFSPSERAEKLYREMAANAPDPRVRAEAESLLKPFEILNKPLKLSFKATDGAEIDAAKMKGKVVLIDFWATWCGPCIASLPELKRVYEEFHGQGFEIIGVSFDEDCDAMKKFVGREKMPWPQFCDGGKWENAVNKEFGIRGIPTLYLVDKKGVVRDLNAREDLAGKVKALLAEPVEKN